MSLRKSEIDDNVDVDETAPKQNSASNLHELSMEVEDDSKLNESTIQADQTIEQTERVDCLNEKEYFQSKILELGRRLWTSSLETQHYTKGKIYFTLMRI